MTIIRHEPSDDGPRTVRHVDFTTRESRHELADVVCVGFGPANIALAIALDEIWPQATAKFLEKAQGPGWQPDMLLSGSDIQNNPVRDLVTPRNPRSRYTFINYLHENGRLFRHLNLPGHFPLRKEYARYITWVAENVPADVEYSQEVTTIKVASNAASRRVMAI